MSPKQEKIFVQNYYLLNISFNSSKLKPFS
nr:MAG TPA: hypothetical protein [Caudoviricetes sp.]